MTLNSYVEELIKNTEQLQNSAKIRLELKDFANRFCEYFHKDCSNCPAHYYEDFYDDDSGNCHFVDITDGWL